MHEDSNMGNFSDKEHQTDLLRGLIDLWRERQWEFDERWSRTLPLADYVVDRWEKARLLGFGEESSIYDSSLVLGDVAVGRNTWIGPFTILDGSGGGLSIGVFCSISAGVHIYTHDTVAWAVTGGRAAARQAAVKIDDCCYIGSQTVIAPGVTIGPRCVVGANSFVNRDCEAGHVYFGSPVRKVGRVEIAGDKVQIDYFQGKEGQ